MISVTLRSLGVVSSRIINLGCFKVTSCRCSSQVAAATSVNLVDKGVNIDWRKSDREQSGEQPVRGSFFHGIWLRHNCHCPLCYNLHSDQFTVEADELPNVRVTQAKVNGQLMRTVFMIGYILCLCVHICRRVECPLYL